MVDQYTGEEKRHVPRSPVTELSYSKFGAPTRVSVSQVTVNSTPSEFVKSNPNRIALLLINNSSTDIYLSFVPEVSSTYCIPLGADGASMKMSFDDYGEAITEGLHGVASTDSNNLTLIEVLVGGV